MGAASYRVDPPDRIRLTRPLAHASTPSSSSRWQQELQDAVRDVAELERLLGFPSGSLVGNGGTGTGFPLLVPRGFVARMRERDADDPLLRQVLPAFEEDRVVAGYDPDPIEEQGIARQGAIMKYPGRALLITTGACPVHCRYCFRREFPYADQTASRDDWGPALETIRATPGVREVILSGGDPLSLSNERLARLVSKLEAMSDVETLRLHTRFPVVLPARVDAGLIGILEATRLATVVVLHVNHPAEIDAAVADAARDLKRATQYLLNQSVLLRGVNDDVETLIRLSERLRDCGIVPYYLHLLDRVSGTARFDVAEDEAVALIAAMRARAPGYLVPKLVRDVPAELSKTPIG
jgi:L-lysine 2,3-aminomutase